MQSLPDTLYKVDSVVQLEQVAINQYGIPAYDLMKRAGKAVFDVIQANYSQNKVVLVLCGAGNNAGDGYVVAKLAKAAGYDVHVISLIDPDTLKNEAQLAYQDWVNHEGSTVTDIAGETELAKQLASLLTDADIIIDALLGTGLKRDVSLRWAEWITTVNQSAKQVISVDIPSGLMADTGAIAGVAIKADITVCFIGLKQGMFTAQGNDVCGEIIFNDLALPDDVYTHIEPDARLIQGINYSLLPKRKASSHKGCFGHVLIAGGNNGMPGAVILAARAALRSGAGLVTVITVPQHIDAISTAVPEAMIKTCDIGSIDALFNESFISDVTHVAIGMGLGQDEWSLHLLQHCMRLHKPMLIDADALNLIAGHDFTEIKQLAALPLVITPHPGEAGRLLSKTKKFSSKDVQLNRYDAINKLHAFFSDSETCTVILKGSGTLIFNGQTMKVCKLGNAAMAAPGMGDVLSGIIIALMAQNIKLTATIDIAELAVCLHAAAAEWFIADKTRGLLASDIIDTLPKVLQ